MYTLLSYLPKLLLPSKTRFEQYVHENIFVPLGMRSTTYSYDLAKKTGKLANGFGREGVNQTQDLFGPGTPRAMEYWNQAGGEDGNCKSNRHCSANALLIFDSQSYPEPAA